MQRRYGFSWDKISYGNWLGFSSQLFNPKSLSEVGLSELFLLQIFTFIAVKNEDWLVRASVSWLQDGLGNRMKSGAIKRGRESLCRKGLLELHELNQVDGNWYVVNPILFRTDSKSPRSLYGHWQEASFLMETYLDRNMVERYPPSESDQIDPTVGSLRSDQEIFSSLESDQIDPHSIDNRSLLEETDATRYMCPNGQIGKKELPDKGVSLPADSIPEAREGVLADPSENLPTERRRERQPLTHTMAEGLSKLHAQLDALGVRRPIGLYR